MNKLLVVLLAFLAAPVGATTYSLTISTIGPVSGSSVVSSTGGIICPSTCTVNLSSGTVVTLTAISASTTVFAGWGGANGCSTNLRTCRLTMNGNRAVSATFNPILRLSLYGNGLGTISNSSGTINCTGLNACARHASQTYSFAKGTTIVLTEVPNSSSTFTGWTGDGGCTTASTCTFTLNGYKVIVATFSSTGPFNIAVSVRGQGTVKSSPAGINCGSTCSYPFSAGTPVTLTTAAAAGYYFGGWGNGGCSGLNVCVVTSSSAQQALGGAESPRAFFYPQ